MAANCSPAVDYYTDEDVLLQHWRWNTYILAGCPLLALAAAAIAINMIMLIKFCRSRFTVFTAHLRVGLLAICAVNAEK